ncbi:hypothetical protein BpHYR1_025095 [Brachionus plicatilis]|uniref:Uncharacterized protein n=1 Tax=Brachionus plicatilis TaxID=10195 RepID=A0A3M7RGR0_BRAPC|nr:hypothetical protein BpHYR1_025095 [Brachionus plicatilis]
MSFIFSSYLKQFQIYIKLTLNCIMGQITSFYTIFEKTHYTLLLLFTSFYVELHNLMYKYNTFFNLIRKGRGKEEESDERTTVIHGLHTIKLKTPKKNEI